MCALYYRPYVCIFRAVSLRAVCAIYAKFKKNSVSPAGSRLPVVN